MVSSLLVLGAKIRRLARARCGYRTTTVAYPHRATYCIQQVTNLVRVQPLQLVSTASRSHIPELKTASMALQGMTR